MNLGQMIDEVKSLVSSELADAEVIKMIQRSHEREARELQFPQYTVTAAGVTEPFSLPSGARSDGLLEVRREEDGVRLPILNTQEASREYQNWRDWDAGDTRFVIYDPKMVGLDGLIRPVPLPEDGSPQSYVLTYVAKPDDLTRLDDEPWNGTMDSYHDLLVLWVASQFMFRAGDARAEILNAEYQVLRRDAFTALRPRLIYANNPVYRAVMNDG